MSAARVPSLQGARGVVWLLLAILLALRSLPPGAPDAWAIVALPGGCALAAHPDAPPCRCERLPAPLRRLLALPLPLETATSSDLETLPGVGPGRAEAIVRERSRRGGFARVADLEAVHGLGPKSVAALMPHLFVGADPACAHENGLVPNGGSASVPGRSREVEPSAVAPAPRTRLPESPPRLRGGD